jgi:cholesterol transport system auxiliary component
MKKNTQPNPRRAFLLATAGAAAMAGCSSILPDKPPQRTQYDFGPGAPVAPTAPPSAQQQPLLLAEVDAAGSFESTALLYRLGYADANELRAYAFARWSTQPALLIRQRLREHLGRERLVLDNEEAAALARAGGARPRVLRVALEEFAQNFESQAQSHGVLRLRCTLLDNTPAGERLIGQRVIAVQRPAPTPDAPGGVRALAAATDAAAEDIAAWLRQVR